MLTEKEAEKRKFVLPKTRKSNKKNIRSLFLLRRSEYFNFVCPLFSLSLFVFVFTINKKTIIVKKKKR